MHFISFHFLLSLSLLLYLALGRYFFVFSSAADAADDADDAAPV